MGVVGPLVPLPSCEALEVAPREAATPPLLVPLVRDCVRSVDLAGGVVDVDLGFLGDTLPADLRRPGPVRSPAATAACLRAAGLGLMQLDVVTLFPEAFEGWFARPAPRRQRARSSATSCAR